MSVVIASSVLPSPAHACLSIDCVLVFPQQSVEDKALEQRLTPALVGQMFSVEGSSVQSLGRTQHIGVGTLKTAACTYHGCLKLLS